MTDTTTRPVSESSNRNALRWRGYGRPLVASAAALGLVATVGCAATADTGVGWFMKAGTGLLSRTSTSAGSVSRSAEGALVDIVSTEGYQGATAAGTGMVLSSNGEVLTNNHVINGATSIKVTVVSTGKTYAATVVGTDATDDVAVIQLRGASGLKTIPIETAVVQVGERVKASGNAGGTGKTSTVSGAVTGLNRTITASSEDGSDAQQLSGLIETDALIVPGDSGGALTTISGKVIGMNTAAAASNVAAGSASGAQSAASDAYAIPIQTALSIAEKIENGQASSTIHIGTRGFLGIELQAAGVSNAMGGRFGRGEWGSTELGSGFAFGTGTSGTLGVTVAGVVPGGAAAAAGLSPGDVITSINGVSVDSSSTLNTVMASTRSGQRVTIGWTDAARQTQTAATTLTAAPAD